MGEANILNDRAKKKKSEFMSVSVSVYFREGET